MHLSPCPTRLFPGVQYISSASSSGSACLWPQKGQLHCYLREESSLQDGGTVITQTCFHLGRLCTYVCMCAGVWGACIQVCGVLFQPSPEGRLSSPSFVPIPSQPAEESVPWKWLECLWLSRLIFLDVSIPSPRSSASPKTALKKQKWIPPPRHPGHHFPSRPGKLLVTIPFDTFC